MKFARKSEILILLSIVMSLFITIIPTNVLGLLAQDGFESNDSFGTAKPIVTDVYYEYLTAHDSFDVDYYNLTLIQDILYKFEFWNCSEAAWPYLYNSTGNLVCQMSVWSGGVNNSFGYIPESTQLFTLKIDPMLETYYCFYIEPIVDDDYENNDVIGEAEPISKNALAAERVLADEDWHSISLLSTDSLHINITDVETIGNHGTNFEVILYNSSFQEVVLFKGQYNQFYFFNELAVSGTYYILINFTGYYYRYTLKLTAPISDDNYEDNNLKSSAEPISYNIAPKLGGLADCMALNDDWYSIYLDLEDHHQLFQVVIELPVYYEIELMMEIVSSAGTVLSDQVLYNSTCDSVYVISLEIQQSDTYFIHIAPLDTQFVYTLYYYESNLSRPIDQIIPLNNEGDEIIWQIHDYEVLLYMGFCVEIYRDGILIKENLYQYPSSNDYPISIDTTEEGTYVYNINVYSTYYPSMNFSDEVIVTIGDGDQVFLSQPEDQTITIGTTGNKISWTPTESGSINLRNYTIYKDDVDILNGTWSPETPIQIDIDDLPIGEHEYKIIIQGDFEVEFDIVLVTVTIDDGDQVFLSHPENQNITLGTTGNKISWTPTESGSINLRNYTIYKDGVEILTGTWTPGIAIDIDIDNLPIGTYEYKIVIQGDFEVEFDTVIITVKETTSISGYSVPILMIGLFGMIIFLKKRIVNK